MLKKTVLKLTIFDNEYVTSEEMSKALEFEGLAVETLERFEHVTAKEMDQELHDMATLIAVQKRVL